MPKTSGQCHCGACRYHSDSAPDFAIRCYCSDCREVSGSSHLPQVGIPAQSITFEGPIAHFDSKAASGSDLRLRFCGTCSSPLAKTTSRAPDLMFLMAGTLAPDVAIPALRNVFEEGRPDWDSRSSG